MFAYKNGQRGYTDGRWKLIRFPWVDRTLLFDLQNDPNEINNLAVKPEYATKVVDMITLLKNEMGANGDQVPLNVAEPKPAAWAPPVKVKE